MKNISLWQSRAFIYIKSKKIIFLISIFYATLLIGHKVYCQKSGAYLDVGDSKIYYEDAGKGEFIILLHDGLVNSMIWDGVWEELSKKYHVVRYDRRGYGLSDTASIPFLQSDDLFKLMTHLKISKATLVGCSSGGGIAIDFSLAHPKMVERLILIGSVLHGMVVSSAFGERGEKNNAPLAKNDFKSVAKNWSNDSFTIASGDSVGKQRLYAALIKYPKNLKYAGNMEIRFAIPAVRRLSEIHTPTLLLIGENDMPDVHAFGGAIQAGIAGARREIVKDCAHLIPLEKPEYLRERIISFIEKHPYLEVPDNILEKYVGKYAIWGTTAKIVLKDHHLYFQIPGEWELPLFPESISKMKLFMWGHDAEMEFVKDLNGNIIQAIIYGEEDRSITKCPRI